MRCGSWRNDQRNDQCQSGLLAAAQLQEANLEFAELQKANLLGARLQGGEPFQHPAPGGGPRRRPAPGGQAQRRPAPRGGPRPRSAPKRPGRPENHLACRLRLGSHRRGAAQRPVRHRRRTGELATTHLAGEIDFRLPQKLGPLGGVERPRRVVRFARLMHRPVRAFGRPSAGAAFGGSFNQPSGLVTPGALRWLAARPSPDRAAGDQEPRRTLRSTTTGCARDSLRRLR